MSKLQELIQKLCPNGVEYKRLGDVCEIKRGVRVTRSSLVDGGAFSVFQNSLTPLGNFDRYNRDADKTFVICAGAAGEIGYSDKPFWAADDCFTIEAEKLHNRYVYHFLLANKDFLKSKVRKASVPRVSATEIGKLVIPIPHPDIQEEIVRILDNFTNLAAELQAELQARQEQYEYYRNKLLTFNELNGVGQSVTWMKMSEIGEICMCKRITKDQTNNIDGVPFYKIGTFGKVADAYISRDLYEDYKSRFSFPRKGEILISASGTIGRTVVYDGRDAYFQDSNIVWVHNDETKVLNKYLYHYYQIIEWEVEGGTIKRLYNNNLAKTKIVVPPISEQEHIVSILDKFETLVNDLTEGLPAEMAAVQEQYEYYRNKLLSFPRTKISA